MNPEQTLAALGLTEPDGNPDDEQCLFWQTIIDAMMDGLMVVDRNGVIVSVNPAMETLTGFGRDELVGSSCQVLDCDACRRCFEGDGPACPLFKRGKVIKGRCVIRRRDGSTVPVLKNAAVLKNNRGKILGGVETLTDLSQLTSQEETITRLRRQLSGADGFHGIIGRSAAINRTTALIESAASSDAPVVITGESGVGKELAAAAIHKLGQRRDGPFVKVNCAALNESLLESELFGHVKGAFTGADRSRIGRFQAAHGGDIFLDEIGDLPPSTQIKLLRVLQEKEIERVGDHNPIKTDVRIITATNRNLQQLMDEGSFRSDLYYRIAVIPLHLPPLRERLDDIPLLVEHFLDRLNLKTGKSLSGVTGAAMNKLTGYHWPGNVRELINTLEYAFVLCPEGAVGPEHLPRLEAPPTWPPTRPDPVAKPVAIDRRAIVEALERTGGNKSQAAELLGISRVTLWKKLKALNVQASYS